MTPLQSRSRFVSTGILRPTLITYKTSTTVSMPFVVGQTVVAAAEKLNRIGLVLDETVQPGLPGVIVCKTAPAGGTVVALRSPVTLFIGETCTPGSLDRSTT